MQRLAVVIIVLAMVAAACTGDDGSATTTTAVTSSTSTVPTTAPPTSSTTAPSTPTTEPPAVPGVRAAFASFAGVPLLDGPEYAGPALPTDFDDVLVAPIIDSELSGSGAAGSLLDDGFVIVPQDDLRLFHQAYDAAAYEVYPVYVTTDVGYHLWHLVFSKTVREIEEGTLLPILDDFLAGALAAARAQQAELEGTALADSATRIAEWFQVAGSLAGHDVGPLSARAQEELDLATTATEFIDSPITSFEGGSAAVSAAGIVDYSQMRPRGHYTRSDDLQRYFRAMSFMGQSAFFLKEPPSLRLGTLAARLITADPELTAQWLALYEPTGFLVGAADDYTPYEVGEAAEVAFGGLGSLPAIATDESMEALADQLEASRPVLINPEGASMRVMGTRFVVDSFVLDQLTWPNVGREPPPERRVTPSGLDVAATFGSDLARELQLETESEFFRYEQQLDAMTELISTRAVDAWAATVYDAWLYALGAVWAEHGNEFPDYMRTPLWATKALQTGLGSYAELKHDTILYAKQGFAAEGGGEPEPFVPRHWVEPDPVAFERLAVAAQLIRDGFDDRGLLSSERAELLDDLIGFEERLGRIARDELAGTPISEEDNLWLRFVGGEIEAIWLASSDIDEDTGLPESGDQDGALIADIFSSTFVYLEIGTGRVDLIYVLVPNDEGRFQIARGGVYSYYEFTQPRELGRLTDEEWRSLLDTAPPDRPGWQSSLFGGGGAGAELPETFQGIPSGLFCRDLFALGHPFSVAYEYWDWDGRPDRMDADRNGIPCETVYPPEEIAAYLGG
jgi:hypothetical protein